MLQEWFYGQSYDGYNDIFNKAEDVWQSKWSFVTI